MKTVKYSCDFCKREIGEAVGLAGIGLIWDYPPANKNTEPIFQGCSLGDTERHICALCLAEISAIHEKYQDKML